ncbi:hypothetical protein VK792_14380 [Mesobacterium sp. TK19101]|uniref:SnoaL-like domain-containing protein n=1 Tax=Mesobacterium hydrothermale TaxID=3111907 RepID=A0ABU6HKS1_9RHOB|nr:hypothetical protein [Mesobacterium sp. TK19101]MEC3862476.1 hypothetical protein [Mesobacterium sp. TK19101]
MATARDIYQANLDAVTRALWTRDLELMLRHLAIPNMMLTADREIVLSSALEMEIAMNDFRDHLGRLGAQEYHRVCKDAVFLDKDRQTLAGRHVTYILREGEQIMAPYWNDMTLLLIDGQWKGTRIESTACNAAFPIICDDMARGQKSEIASRTRAGKE